MTMKNRQTNENKPVRVFIHGKKGTLEVEPCKLQKILTDGDYAIRTARAADETYAFLKKVHMQLGEENQNYEWTVMQVCNDLEEDSLIKKAIDQNPKEMLMELVKSVVEFEKRYCLEALQSKYFTKEEKKGRLKMLRNKRMNLSLEDISKETEIPIEELKKLIDEN